MVSASFVWASSRSKLGMVGEADSLHFFPFFLLPSLSFRVLGGLGGLGGLGILDGLGIFTVLEVFFLDTFSRRDRGGVASMGDGGSSFSRSPSQTSSEEATAFTSGRTVFEAFWYGKRRGSFVFPLDHARTQETLTGMLGEAVSPERHTQLTPCDTFIVVAHCQVTRSYHPIISRNVHITLQPTHIVPNHSLPVPSFLGLCALIQDQEAVWVLQAQTQSLDLTFSILLPSSHQASSMITNAETFP